MARSSRAPSSALLAEMQRQWEAEEPLLLALAWRALDHLERQVWLAELSAPPPAAAPLTAPGAPASD